jgi:NADH:ubiquinone reductase (non-electrogenic)
VQSAPGIYTSLGENTKKVGKPRVVVLGSGWGAMGFIKSLPSNIR